MKTKIKRLLAVALSIMLAASVFSVVPVSALENYENITFKSASGSTAGEDLSDSLVPFADKKANLIVNSSLAGTEMTVNEMDSAYLESTFGTKTNQVELVSFLPYKGKTGAYETPARADLSLAGNYGHLADRKIYDSANTSTPGWGSAAWINGTEGTSYEQWYKATNGSFDGLLKDEQRVSAGCYDADVILTLNSLTKIDSLYLFSHPELRISPKTYAIFASDNEADLFEKGNQIVFYNYSPTNTENKYAFNNAGGDGTSRRSEGAVYTFTGTKPTARFIGIRFYDLNQDRNTDFALYDFGVYGKIKTNGFHSEVNSSSKKNVVVPGEADIEVVDSADEPVDELTNGEEYTLTAPDLGKGYTFDGWYVGESTKPASTDLVFTATYNGDEIVAKYSTDYILNVKASDKVAMTLGYVNAPMNSVYDEEEDALKFVGTSTSKGGALVSTFTDTRKSLYDTQFEPWTIYKYTLRAKFVTDSTVTNPQKCGINANPSGLCNRNTAGVSHQIYVNPNEDYQDYTFYFHSGAADWTYAPASTAMLSTNWMNMDIPQGYTYYFKGVSIEKAGAITAETDENSSVEILSNQEIIYAAGHPDLTITENENAYGGATKVDDAAAYLKAQDEAKGYLGAASPTDTLRFKVNCTDGYTAKTVTVNGEVVNTETGVYEVENKAAGAKITVVSDTVCNVNGHTFDKEVKDDKYLKTPATCTTPAVYYKSCVCGSASETETFEGDTLPHTYDKEIVSDDTLKSAATCASLAVYYKSCKCGEISKTETFTFGEKDAANHTGETKTVGAKAATCTAKGYTGDKVCSDCGAVLVKGTETPALGHKLTTKTTKATLSANGKIVTSCTVCKAVTSTKTISRIKTVKLSTTSYTYSGSSKKPSVTVKDYSGKTLKNGTDYTVSYKNNKNVGTATATVTFKGNYQGSKKLTFTIKPKTTSLSKLTAGKKQLKVTWKKNSAVSGYQIQYSTSKKFTSPKTVTVKGYKTTSKTIKSLKAKKTYYVRVRTYKTVNGKKVYSDWSAKALSKKTK